MPFLFICEAAAAQTHKNRSHYRSELLSSVDIDIISHD
jgi:hypothetical protein